MKAFDSSAVSGLTAYRTVTVNGDLGIPVKPNSSKKIYPRAILLSADANVTVVGIDDDDPVVIPNLASGMWHPMCVKKITAISTGNAVVGY